MSDASPSGKSPAAGRPGTPKRVLEVGRHGISSRVESPAQHDDSGAADWAHHSRFPEVVVLLSRRSQKNILITGASRGLGLLTSIELTRRGHRVFAGMRSPSASPAFDAAGQQAWSWCFAR